MKITAWFRAYPGEVPKELFGALLTTHPAGERRTWPCTDGARIVYFECELPPDDPKLDQLIQVLQQHGCQRWQGRSPKQSNDVLFEYRRIYEATDFESAELLEPLPSLYIGSGGTKNEVGLMLLDPESESVNEARDGLKPFIIGHTSPDGLVVSNELKEIMEKSGLLEMVFKPVLSKYNPDHGPISGCWELTTDFLLPPLSNPELDDGFYTPPEFRYRSAGIKAALPFDIGRCREYGNIIVSGRFYRFCAEQKLDMTWQPVRIDPD